MDDNIDMHGQDHYANLRYNIELSFIKYDDCIQKILQTNKMIDSKDHKGMWICHRTVQAC